MKLFPAIDLKMGQAVRLYKGDFNKKTVVNTCPQNAFSLFLTQGARQLHLVDLDGALGDRSINLNVIKSLCQMAQLKDVPVQLGGGLKTVGDVEQAIEMGVSNVILGSMVVSNFHHFKKLLIRYPEKIVAGLDVENGVLKTEGWIKSTNICPIDMAAHLNERGLRRIILTDISKDGTLAGPNIELCLSVKAVFDGEVIVSGGVSSYDDLIAIKSLGLDGAVVGKALYSGAISLEDWEVACGL